MNITLDSAAIGTGLGAALPPLTLHIVDGAPAVVAVETDERPMLVSMMIGGRVKADAGHVTIDGADDPAELRHSTALVDTPFVSEPPAGVALSTVVREELSFSDLPTSRAAVSRFLAAQSVTEYASLPVRSLPPVDRIRVFSELALLRPGVRCLIITSPERHGAAPSEWFETLRGITERGVAVVIVTDVLTRNFLLTLGAADATAQQIDDIPESQLS